MTLTHGRPNGDNFLVWLGRVACAAALVPALMWPPSAHWAEAAKPRTIQQARVAVTGHDTNQPDPFPGWGGFAWPGNIVRLPDGQLMLVHSAGYWHVSFAEPRAIEPSLRKHWLAEGWPLDFPAPTGGRSMASRSRDSGRTWTKPQTVVDLPWDDGACGLLRCQDGTLLCFINVQASWYGYKKAPEAFRDELAGLNTRQCVVRSTDDGKTWSEPIWIASPGDFYERSHAQPIQLPDGAILWPTYCSESGSPSLFGAIHRSDDSGKTWRTVSTVRREGGTSVDEPAIARLDNGRLLMVCRPDGGVLYSKDEGASWQAAGSIVSRGKFKAPRLFVLKDGTVVCVCTYGNLRVFLSLDRGASWTDPIPLDPSSYGYPGGIKLDDESILVSYCSSGRAPSRIYVVRFKVNTARDGIELLQLGQEPAGR